MVLIRRKILDAVKTSLIIFLFVFSCALNYKYVVHYNSSESWAAKEWVEEHVPKKSAILMQPRTIPFSRARLFMILFDPQNISNQNLYISTLERYTQRHPEENYEIWTGNFLKDTIINIDNKNINYIVLSEIDYDQEGINWLNKNAILVKSFVRHGNTWRIRIYKVLHPSTKKKECAACIW